MISAGQLNESASLIWCFFASICLRITSQFITQYSSAKRLGCRPEVTNLKLRFWSNLKNYSKQFSDQLPSLKVPSLKAPSFRVLSSCHAVRMPSFKSNCDLRIYADLSVHSMNFIL